MHYQTIAPPPELSRFVRFYWELEHEPDSKEPYFHKTMADGCPEMIFHYKGRFDEITDPAQAAPSFLAGIHGPSQHFRRFTIHGGFGIFGVYLYPFAIPVLFNIPASEVANEMPDLVSILGKAGAELEDKIFSALTTAERVATINDFLRICLLKTSVQAPAVFSMIGNMIRDNGLTDLSIIRDQSALSERQFERKFKAFSGFSPKLFSRIIRFQSTLSAYGDKERSLTEIAYDHGYYDQSHFIHDFRSFSGEHPKKFFSGNVEGMEYRDV